MIFGRIILETQETLGTPEYGQITFVGDDTETTTGKFYVTIDDSTSRTLSLFSISNPPSNNDILIYDSSGDVLSPLSPTANYVLTANGSGVPQWSLIDSQNIAVDAISHLDLTSLDGGDRNVGGHTYAVQRYEDTSDPTANDDSADTSGNGTFYTGDIWINTTDDSVFVCADDTATSAIWTEIGSGGSSLWTRTGTVLSPATAGDDVALSTGEKIELEASSTESKILVNETGDTDNRLEIYSDGEIKLGSGSASLDTNLYRGGDDLLKTDDKLYVSDLLTADDAIDIKELPSASVSSPASGYIRAYAENNRLYHKDNIGLIHDNSIAHRQTWDFAKYIKYDDSGTSVRTDECEVNFNSEDVSVGVNVNIALSCVPASNATTGITDCHFRITHDYFYDSRIPALSAANFWFWEYFRKVGASMGIRAYIRVNSLTPLESVVIGLTDGTNVSSSNVTSTLTLANTWYEVTHQPTAGTFASYANRMQWFLKINEYETPAGTPFVSPFQVDLSYAMLTQWSY